MDVVKCTPRQLKERLCIQQRLRVMYYWIYNDVSVDLLYMIFVQHEETIVYIRIHPSIHPSINPRFSEKSPQLNIKYIELLKKKTKKTAHQYQQRKKKKTTCTSYIDVFLEIPKVKACINHIVNASVREPKSPNYIMFPTFYNVTVFKLVCN